MEESNKHMTLEERAKHALDRSKHILFYKEGSIWYADVDGHTKEENEMIEGADIFLDIVSNGENTVGFEVSDEIYPKAKFLLKRVAHDNYGATYQVLGNHPNAPALSASAYMLGIENEKLWLCNVVHTFFGEHPEYISIL